MTRVRLVVVLAVLLLAPAAGAHTMLLRDDGTTMGGPWQQWVDRARVPTPDVTVRVSFTNPAAGPDVAYIWPGDTTIYVPKPDLITPELLLHEIGHIYDVMYLRDSERAAIMQRVLHRPGAWREGPPDSPHEQFAEAYAVEATTRAYRPVTGGYGVRLSRGDFHLLRMWLVNVPRLRALGL
jgi:hypothetical protein